MPCTVDFQRASYRVRAWFCVRCASPTVLRSFTSTSCQFFPRIHVSGFEKLSPAFELDEAYIYFPLPNLLFFFCAVCFFQARSIPSLFFEDVFFPCHLRENLSRNFFSFPFPNGCCFGPTYFWKKFAPYLLNDYKSRAYSRVEF